MEEHVDAEDGGVGGLVADGVRRDGAFPAGAEVVRGINHGERAVEFDTVEFGRKLGFVAVTRGEGRASFDGGELFRFAEQAVIGREALEQVFGEDFGEFGAHGLVEGLATVAGFDVARQPADVRESISLTGQFAAVDEILTGRENLLLMARLWHRKDGGLLAEELLTRFQLSDAAERRVATYSGGMRRRLDLAMSLIGDPPVIFLDEPTTGLDPQARLEVWASIKELAAAGTTVLLTT